MSKFLGQHFLKNREAIDKIVAALDLQGDNVVVEIGPGHGELTEHLLAQSARVIAIEKDRLLAQELAKRFSIFNDQFSVIEGDALKVIPQLKMDGEEFKITGNIPYYITGHLLRILSEQEHKPALTVLTMQKEVAERIVAQPPKMNRLAAITQFWAEPEIVLTLKPRDFDPPPEVESAVIKLKTKNHFNNCDRSYNSRYYETVRILFQQPRKTVLNNLLSGLKIPKKGVLKKIKKLGLTSQTRPQNLSISQINDLL